MRPTLIVIAALSMLPVAWAATSFVVEISNATANEAHTMKVFDTISIGFGDFDGNGRVEIVTYNDNFYLYVMSTDASHVYAEFQPPRAGDGAPPNTSPVVKDVDGNGALDIVVVSHAAYTCRYEYDAGASTSTAFAFVTKWCKRADKYDGSTANADGAPWVDDVDGDGDMETFMQTEQVGHFAYDADGSTRWSKQASGGNAGPVTGDLDGDGDKEVVFFSDSGRVVAYDASTGALAWSKKYVFAWPASIPVGGAIGDLDGNGKKEVVYMLRDAEDAVDLDANHLFLVVLNHDGSLKWKVQPAWANPMSYTHPVLVDVDGDGKLEIVAQDWNTMGWKPGDWEPLGPANVFAYRADGSLLWQRELNNGWSNDDVAVADADGDGDLEVLAIGTGPNGQGYWMLDAKTGAKETHVGAGSWTPHRGPWVADLGDGDVGVVLGVATSSKGGGFRVYDTNVDCTRVVFGAWGLTDPCDPPGGSGAPPPPPPPPPPPTGTFDATFRNVRGNTWWVESDVSANEPLAGVDARVNAGAWIALTHQSWGSWAKSINAPPGSQVEFRARSTGGGTDTSSVYTWPP